MRLLHRFLWLTLLGLVACGRAASPTPTAPADPTIPSADNDAILVDGSSTVGPITQLVSTTYQATDPTFAINVAISGTGGGFRRFCAGETDISDASRPIKETEAAACASNGVQYIELPVAFDGLAVLVNPANEIVTCLTRPELQKIWEPDAWQTITNWQQIRSDFPDQPLVLYGAGSASGTYDYFTEAIVGEEGVSRPDFWASEDDDLLVDGISTDPNALGFFGLAYYERNRDRVKLVAVDNGSGCVEPNTETVAKGLYQPLSRPLFIYINIDSLTTKPSLREFVTFYLSNAPQLVDDVGYIPLTDAIYTLAQQRFEAQTTGSVFEDGSSVGVSLADLLMREQ